MMHGASHRLGAVFNDDTGDKINGIWVDLFKLGKTYVPTSGDPKAIEITPEVVYQAEANFNLMASIGDPPNVQKQHKDDGYQYGDVLKVRTEGEWFQAFITFADPEDRERYNRGQIRKFSPGFHTNFMRTDTGQRIGFHVFDVSFVTRAHQHDLRDPNDINPGITLGAINGGPPMAEEETSEEFDAKAAFTALAEKFAAFEARFAEDDEEEAPAEEEEEMSAKLAALNAKVAAHRDELIEMKLAAYDIDDAKTASLVKLHQVDSVLFSAIVADLPKKKADSIQAEIGSVGGGEKPSGKLNFAAICDKAVEDGHDIKSATFAAFAFENHPNQWEELNAFARTHKTEAGNG